MITKTNTYNIFRSWVLVFLATVLFGVAQDSRAQPVFQATGTANSGIGAVTVAWPVHLAGDVALLFVESQRDQPVTLSTPAGFVQVTSSPQFTNAGTGTRLTVFWARATSAAMASPTIAAPGDHAYGVIVTYRRVINTGDPWDVTSGGVKNAASTSVSVTGLTTTVDNTRVVQAVARDNDSAAAAFSGQTNATLTGIAERSDAGTTSGHGGGIGIWDGLDATAGTVNNTTATVTSSVNAFMSIALRPATTFYSRASTTWSTTTTWSAAGCGGSSAAQVPPAGVNVVICDGNTVTLDTNSANIASLTIQSTGTLTLGNSNTTRTLTVAGNIDNSGLLQYGSNTGDHAISVGGQFINSGTFTHIDNTSGGARSLTVTGLLNNSGTFTFAGRANNGEIITVNANGGLTNSGTLQVNVNSNNTHALNVGGNFTNNGTVQFAPDGDSLVNVVFNGSAAQSITGTAAGTTTFYNATLNNSSGLTLTGSHNMAVSNVLTLTSGVLTTGSNVLAVTNTAAGGVTRGTGFVEGGLTWALPTGNPGVRNFPLGTGTTYSPLSLTFTGVATGGNITGRAIAGDHPDVANSGVDEGLAVNRYWSVSNSGVVFTDYAAVFEWVAGDLDVGADTNVFEAQRYDGVWNATTPGTRTGTTLQVTGVTGFGEFAIGQPFSVAIGIGRFNAYDTTTAGGAVSGLITTKVAGSAFNLDIIAISTNRKSIQTSYNGTVQVELLNASDNSGTPDSTTGCNSSWTVIQTVTSSLNFVGSDNGRKTLAVTENNAWREVRVRITELPGGSRIGCSTDALAIRPASLTVSASDNDSSTAGTGRLLNTAGATGGNVHRAGRPFTVTAAAAPASATNYDGTPTVSALACTLPGGCVNGVFDVGAFSGSGARVSSTATYSEAGVFNLTLIDETYTLIDATDGTPADCSASGRFVCQSAAPVAVGRFVPDRFVFSAPSTPMLLTFGSNSCGTRSFTYVGQPFWYNPVMLPSATLQAVNAAGAVTANYPLDTASARPSITETYADSTAPVAAPLNFSGIGTVASSSGAGTGSYTAASTGVLSYDRTTAVTQFNAVIALTVNANDTTESAVTGNGVITSTVPLVFDGGGTGIAFDAGNTFRFGRLRLVGASGARQLPLRVPFETQYWTGTFFAANAQDSCTAVTSGHVALGNNIGGLTTTVTAVSALSGGRGTITLSAPNASGSVDLAVLLGASAATCSAFAPPPGGSGNAPWLRGQWCGAAYDRDPVARARFGIRRGSSEVIFIRENY
jgi:hypothetical protein